MLSTILKRNPLEFFRPLFVSSMRTLQLNPFGSFIYNAANKNTEDTGKMGSAGTGGGVIAEVREEDQQHGAGAELPGKNPDNRKYEEWTEKAENEARGKGPKLDREINKKNK